MAACSPAMTPVSAANVLQRLEEQREQLTKNQVKRLRKQLAKKCKQGHDVSTTANASSSREDADDDADASLTRPPAPKRVCHEQNSSVKHAHEKHLPQHPVHSGMTCSDAAQPCSSQHIACSGQTTQQLHLLPAVVPWQGVPLQLVPVPYAVPLAAPGLAVVAANGFLLPAAQMQQAAVNAVVRQAPAAAVAPSSGLLPSRPPVHRRGHHVDLSDAAMLISWAGGQDEQQRTGAAAARPAAAGALGGMLRHHQQPCRTDLSGGVLLVSQELSTGSGSCAGITAAKHAADGQGAAAARKPTALQHGQQGNQQQEEKQEEEQQEEQQQEEQQDKQVVSKRQSRQRFIYGNYHNYYGLRLGHDRQEDPRVKLVQPAWFHDKDCLDIGCNEGVVTLAIATKFATRRMVGVDIDRVLVSKAATNLARLRSSLTQQLQARRTGGSRDASQPRWSLSEHRRRIKALVHTEFRQGDWVTMPCGTCRYDAITVFSVTKWIHMHHGDDGLMAFFHKCFRSLAPGGVLVLEPQPWKSYQNAKHKQVLKDVPYADCDKLKFRPSGFADFLTKRVGFELLCTLQVDHHEAVQGFDRPMLVLRRPDAVTAGDALAEVYEASY